MKNLVIFILLFFYQNISAQLILTADGPGDTYELITSKLAPNYSPYEVPDCGHTSFGRHIDEVWDNELNDNVFRFHIHTMDDDDRCINFDRQRNEIKTYDKSPDSLLGVAGETVEYKWKFKLDAGFQSSPKFTHIHQLKAVGGSESSMPLITLTTRKGTPDELELRHAETTSATTLHEVDLAPFKGTWCEVTETVLYGENGTYSITINKVSDGSILFSYSNNNLRMWKTDADFIRPKWGIYRSLVFANDLRDEEVLFANFSIDENQSALPVELISFTGTIANQEVFLNWATAAEQNNRGFEVQKSLNLNTWNALTFIDSKGNSNNQTDYHFIDEHPAEGQNYYRLKQIDLDGNVKFSDTISLHFDIHDEEILIAPNPSNHTIKIFGLEKDYPFEIFDLTGKVILKGRTTDYKINLSNLPEAIYSLHVLINEKIVVKRFTIVSE